MAKTLFWDDLTVGDRWTSPGRTIAEADVLQFAMLSGDWMPLHTDREYASNGPFGERVAHGILGLAIASGLFLRTEVGPAIQDSVLALLGLEWKFTGPIRLGDTVHLEVAVDELRETSKEDRGIVIMKRLIINQDGDTVQIGTTPILLRRKAQ